MKKTLNFLTLFTSLSTLICCALPALFVALGAGGVLISVTTEIPQLIWISQHKVGVFIFAGSMLLLGGILKYRARNLACPIDPDLAEACKTGRDFSEKIYWFSVVIFLIGIFFAFVAPYLI